MNFVICYQCFIPCKCLVAFYRYYHFLWYMKCFKIEFTVVVEIDN